MIVITPLYHHLVEKVRVQITPDRVVVILACAQVLGELGAILQNIARKYAEVVLRRGVSGAKTQAAKILRRNMGYAALGALNGSPVGHLWQGRNRVPGIMAVIITGGEREDEGAGQ